MNTKTELINARLPELKKKLSPCELCPRKCKAKRDLGETGFCKTSEKLILASWAQHKGEEPPISGTLGSGTIFSSNCTLGCIFCQNFPFSQLGNGKEVDSEKLAEVFNNLCRRGVHNLNFVTPTHVIPFLLDAWLLADEEVKKLPIVYNTSGYELVDVIALLEGIVDIYLPDIKYSNNINSSMLSKAPGYVESNRSAILEMYRQVGEIELDGSGIAKKGIIIRHLILPNNLSGTRESFEWIKNKIGCDVDISLMSQYFPAYKAHSHEEINRPITNQEYLEAIETVEELGFSKIRVQDPTESGGA